MPDPSMLTPRSLGGVFLRRILPAWRAGLPERLRGPVFDGYVTRNTESIVALLDEFVLGRADARSQTYITDRDLEDAIAEYTRGGRSPILEALCDAVLGDFALMLALDRRARALGWPGALVDNLRLAVERVSGPKPEAIETMLEIIGGLPWPAGWEPPGTRAPAPTWRLSPTARRAFEQIVRRAGAEPTWQATHDPGLFAENARMVFGKWATEAVLAATTPSKASAEERLALRLLLDDPSAEAAFVERLVASMAAKNEAERSPKATPAPSTSTGDRPPTLRWTTSIDSAIHRATVDNGTYRVERAPEYDGYVTVWSPDGGPQVEIGSEARLLDARKLAQRHFAAAYRAQRGTDEAAAKVVEPMPAEVSPAKPEIAWTLKGPKNTADHIGEGATGRYIVRRDSRRRATLLAEWQPRGTETVQRLGRVRRLIDGRLLAQRHFEARIAAKATLGDDNPPPTTPLDVGASLARQRLADDRTLAALRWELATDAARVLARDLAPDELAAVIRGYIAEARRLLPGEAEAAFRPRPGGDPDERIVDRPKFRCRRCGTELPEPAEHAAIWVDGSPVLCPAGTNEFEPIPNPNDEEKTR